MVFKDGSSKFQFIGAGDPNDAFVMVFLEYFSDTGGSWEDVDVVVPLGGQDGCLMSRAVRGAMAAGVRGGLRTEGCFAAGIHVLSAAVRQEECSLCRLQELFFLDAVFHVNVDEVFDDRDGVVNGESNEFIDIEFVDKVSGHAGKFFVEFIFFCYLRDIFEEGLRQF